MNDLKNFFAYIKGEGFDVLFLAALISFASGVLYQGIHTASERIALLSDGIETTENRLLREIEATEIRLAKRLDGLEETLSEMQAVLDAVEQQTQDTHRMLVLHEARLTHLENLRGENDDSR